MSYILLILFDLLRGFGGNPPDSADRLESGELGHSADGDLDRAIVSAGRMLDVDPGATLVGGVEVEARELRADRPVRGPARQSFPWIRQVSVPVQIAREPDVVV